MSLQNYSMRPWQVSLSWHLCIMAMMILMILIKPKLVTETYEVAVQIKEPESSQELRAVNRQTKVILKSVNQNQTPPSVIKGREIFGISRNAYTDNTDDGVNVSAKLGNTLSKEADHEQLAANDPDALPVPTEEYLVSEMPILISEFKPEYPKEAKEKQIEGAVTMSILIDEQGIVRQASIIEGPEIFRATALLAIRKFIFGAAKVDGKAVAVNIRYILRFKLEF